MIEVKGTVIDIIYRNDDNLYSVFKLDTDDGEITIVGKVLELNIGDLISVSGNLVFHNEYGEQIQLKSYKRVMPSSISQITRYLSSGIISHIKKKRAEDIVKLFGEKTIEIMSNEPERLLEVPGIGKKTAKKIHESVIKLQDSREVAIYLQKFNLGNKLTTSIYAKYKSDAIEIIENNPYQLVDDIKGIGFLTADKIALNIGIKPDSEFRIKAAVGFILLEAANKEGNCYLEYEVLMNKTAELLKINRDIIEAEIPYLVFENRIKIENIEGKQLVYNSIIYEVEMSIVRRLMGLLYSENTLFDIDVEKEIEYIERLENIEYSETQKSAISTAVKEKMMIITGGPGTGKTTIIKAIISIIKNTRLKFALCAPTGRAAKRMEESTGVEASTIHRLLGYKSLEEDLILEFNEDNPLDVDVLIVDEVSMVDIYLMNNLLKAVDDTTALIFVGDADQLPSVGPGNVLNDMIESGTIPTIKLDMIFRQGEGSNIVKNAHLINNGKLPILNEENKDFFFVDTRSDRDTLNTVVDLVTNRLPNHYKVNPIRDIQILTPTKRGLCGVDNLNKELQAKLNPEQFNKSQLKWGDVIFRENDKIMQIKNNYDIELKDEYFNTTKGLYNGDIGYIRNVFLDNKTIEANYDDKIVTYTNKEFSEIVLSYTATIHKSQGSEFPIVVIPMASAPYMLLTRNILYTGITRGKSLVVLVGSRNIMETMIKNSFKSPRNSTLAYNLIKSKSVFEEHYD
ncbi:SF1B family DNA helicase RecD2 [Helcococcus kunzii]|uniref:ATP-dependent RecD2 DNA helicase n=1 Tax=Helcococcus kunzii ATCC 51366 TaxID=883114 RepID=H3NPW8_9FIRM|nr:ATP-dependent RecD-like DNA helicase [Helcococcus kunzii]EHR33346.1 RecD/TraA family helicase [Helcococcus kunzii ATCC 51366]MCT1796002.1 ATP-dependent RecD-like DNA helicase [Helcococcus kunzii]MCT1988222.1 ATP-dependent RecD-like DNA helicase [Helcococcus kunzii]QUY65283.1 ATP-dependent RecD-like DNA helicase [Helcococcus kunzii]QZO75939.1 ATP-dependent RecD-like DNA helicase [Helcococcus kunzii]